MGMETMTSDLLRGHTDTIVLRVLAGGDSYGFAIYSSILELTGREHEIREPTLYSSLKRLEAALCITSYWGDETREKSQGARRRYYRITPVGRARLSHNVADWKNTVRIMNRILDL